MTSLIDQGARNAVETCLDITEKDRVLIFTDEETLQIGQALERAARSRSEHVVLKTLEEIGERPLVDVPDSLWFFLEEYKPTATFFAANGQEGEIRFRIPLVETMRERYQVRHGHMIGVTPLLMETGMQADYHKVDARTRAVYEKVKQAREIRVTSPSGTDFTAILDPDQLKWVVWGGLYHQPGLWGNLPEGEVFTSPVSGDGVLMASVMGDFFSKKYGLLEEPMQLVIQDGLLQSCNHANEDMTLDFWRYLASVENGRRIGEFAIGTNEALEGLVGNLLQDEKFPGLHVAFGNPYNNYTGATWESPIHVDVVMEQVDILVDGRKIMQDGIFTF